MTLPLVARSIVSKATTAGSAGVPACHVSAKKSLLIRAGEDACAPSTRQPGYYRAFILKGVSLSSHLLAVAIVLLLFALTSRSSTEFTLGPPTTSGFDQYGNLCWEDEQSRLDNFAIQLQNYPKLFGDIVVYAGRNSCPYEAKYRAERAKKWVIKRGVKPERFQVRDGGYRSDVQTILALVPPGREPLSLEPTLKKEEVSIRKHCVDKVFAKVLCLNR